VNELTEVVFLAGRLGLDADGRDITLLMNRLERRGVLARVICLSAGNFSSRDTRVLEFPALGRRWLKMLSLRRFPMVAGFEHPCLLHVVHETMADVSLALAESWRLPYVQTVDDFDVLEGGLKLSHRWFRGLIATSPELSNDLVASLGFPADQITLIAPGVTPTTAAPRSTERKIPVIGTAGHSREGSGFAVFLEAARQVLGTARDAEFLIGSQGKDALDLRRHAQSLRIADRVSVADFAAIGPQFWTVLDIYCQPSIVPSTGRALTLALSEGVPSIATQVKGLRSLIDHGSTGMIVPPGNPESLAAAIIELLDHPDQAILIGSRGQQAARARFDVELEADLLTSLYRRHAALPET
jgi:glycosyltransferase involved in cell wall biosynthesis